jgi:hypothetical protein
MASCTKAPKTAGDPSLSQEKSSALAAPIRSLIVPKKLDLDTLTPEHRQKILLGRAAKKREYERRREELKARSQDWHKANREKAAALRKEWAEANPERKAATSRAHYDRNRKAYLAREAQRYRDLTDCVVRSRLVNRTGLRSKDVPDEVLPEARNMMLVRREIKEAKQALLNKITPKKKARTKRA